MFSAEESRELIDSIGVVSPLGLHDRAPVGIMVYTFVRVGGGVIKLQVQDVYVPGHRTWVRLHEKGKGNSKNGNKYLAWAFSEAAGFARHHDAIARAFYNRKAGKTHWMIAHSARAH